MTIVNENDSPQVVGPASERARLVSLGTCCQPSLTWAAQANRQCRVRYPYSLILPCLRT